MKFIINKYRSYFDWIYIAIKKYYKIIFLLILAFAAFINFLDIFFDFSSHAGILDPTKNISHIDEEIMVDFRKDVTYYKSSELGYWGEKLKVYTPNCPPGQPIYNDTGEIISLCYNDFNQLVQILRKGTPPSSGMTDKDIVESAIEMHNHAEICRKYSTAGTKDPVFKAVILRPIKPGDPMYCIFCKLKESIFNKIKAQVQSKAKGK